MLERTFFAKKNALKESKKKNNFYVRFLVTIKGSRLDPVLSTQSQVTIISWTITAVNYRFLIHNFDLNSLKVHPEIDKTKPYKISGIEN